MGRSIPWSDLDHMWRVGRYGGRNQVCNISWLSVKGYGCGERGKFAFSHWLDASPLQHWSHYRVIVWLLLLLLLQQLSLVLILTLCHVTKLTLINIKTHYFTESSPAFPLQRQASYDHQSLPLETECHLLQSPHNWILQADVQQRNRQQCYLNYSILVTSNSNFKFQICRTHDV